LNGSSIPTRKCSPKFATIRRNQLNIDSSKIRQKKQQKNPKKTQPLLKMMVDSSDIVGLQWDYKFVPKRLQLETEGILQG
jgi:hypothetical protein